MTANGANAEAPTELEKKIIRQIEYYFGDTNLSRDRFLQSKIKEDDGWVPLETMVRFNRLKSLSTDYDVITAALAKSQTGLMEVSEDKQKIRRCCSKPIPADTTENRQDQKKRTVYCKGFKTDDNLDTIQSLLDKYGEVAHIQMRRDKDRKFKGSVFVVYTKEESAAKFIEAKDIKIGETDAIKMFKDDYYKMKIDERKQRREEEKKEKQLEREKREKEAIEAQQADFGDYEKGCVMHFSGVSEQTSREDLKELFGEYGTISWVDFERGQTEGCIRFDEETKAEAVLEKAKAANDDKLVVREKELTVRVLEGDEEAEHWKKVFESKSKIRLRKKMSAFGRGRKFKRGGGRGREGGRPSKTKFEGKKTVFKDSDEEEGEEVEEAEEKKDEPEKGVKRKEEPVVSSESGDAPSAKKVRQEPETTEPAKAEVKQKPESTEPAKAVEKQEPESTQSDKAAVKQQPESTQPAKAAVKQQPESTQPAKAAEKQEPESTVPAKSPVKRPIEETSEAEPAQKSAKTAD